MSGGKETEQVELEIRGVSERDIDLLMLEEIVASADFRRFFLGIIGLTGPAGLIGAARSVNASNGESDLELTLSMAGRRVRVLVENKVDAALQPKQGERYADRASAYVDAGVCDEAVTVLLAPSGYPINESFDHAVEYERILDWLQERAGHSDRHRYKAILLTAALERASTGWTLIPDDQATELWQRYWHLSQEVAPQLSMPAPGDKPATSNFVYFRPSTLPRGVHLIHKLPYGKVDLQFGGASSQAGEFTKNYREALEEGMSIQAAGKSMVVRINVPKVGLETPFETSEEELRKGLGAAVQLLKWYEGTVGTGDGG